MIPARGNLKNILMTQCPEPKDDCFFLSSYFILFYFIFLLKSDGSLSASLTMRHITAADPAECRGESDPRPLLLGSSTLFKLMAFVLWCVQNKFPDRRRWGGCVIKEKRKGGGDERPRGCSSRPGEKIGVTGVSRRPPHASS